MSCVKLIFPEIFSSEDVGQAARVARKKGHSFCDCNQRKIGGLVAIITSTILVLIAALLASGIFGPGNMGFIAGGLTIASMLGYGLAAYFLLSEPEKDPIDKILYRKKS
jgi:hypothetical protein